MVGTARVPAKSSKDKQPPARPVRRDPKEALLDACQLILVEEGASGVTTRRVAARAGLNQALVHYHFGSIQELLLCVNDRMSEEVRERLIGIYSSDAPLIEKWRAHARSFFVEDVLRGYPKIWLELSCLATNQPQLRDRVVPRLDFHRSTFKTALEQEFEKKGLDPDDFPVEALAALVQTSTEGIFTEKLLDYERGHDSLRELVDELIVSYFGPAADGPKRSGRRTTVARGAKKGSRAAIG